MVRYSIYERLDTIDTETQSSQIVILFLSSLKIRRLDSGIKEETGNTWGEVSGDAGMEQSSASLGKRWSASALRSDNSSSLQQQSLNKIHLIYFTNS